MQVVHCNIVENDIFFYSRSCCFGYEVMNRSCLNDSNFYLILRHDNE